MGENFSHIRYHVVEEVYSTLAKLPLALDHFRAFLVEGMLISDELLSTEFESTFTLLLVPVVDARELDGGTFFIALYLYPIVDAGAVEYEESIGEYDIFLCREADCVIGGIVGGNF